VIRVYDDAGNVIDTHEHKGDFKEWSAIPFRFSSRTKSRHDAAADERFSPAVASDPPN